MQNIISIKDITKRFGGLVALKDVYMNIERGQIVSLIGPNGAGKTTLFNVLLGILRPTEGTIDFKDHTIVRRAERAWWLIPYIILTVLAIIASAIYFPLVGLSWYVVLGIVIGVAGILSGLGWFLSPGGSLRPDQITRLGIGRTYQNIRLFREMSILENIYVGMHTEVPTNFIDALFNTPRKVKRESEMLDYTTELLDFVGLGDIDPESMAGNLAYGDQRRLEIARALASDPELILLDEPAAGMNPSETRELMRLMGKIRERGITVFLIEHDMNVVMNISDRVYVLDYGKMISEGTPDEVQNDPRVITAYLGKVE